MLSIKKINFKYGSSQILYNVSVEAKKGEIIQSVEIPWPIDPEKRKSSNDVENIIVTINKDLK